MLMSAIQGDQKKENELLIVSLAQKYILPVSI